MKSNLYVKNINIKCIVKHKIKNYLCRKVTL